MIAKGFDAQVTSALARLLRRGGATAEDGPTTASVVPGAEPYCAGSGPLGPFIGEAAETAIRARLPEGGEVSIELVWDPPWTPERIRCIYGTAHDGPGTQRHRLEDISRIFGLNIRNLNQPLERP